MTYKNFYTIKNLTEKQWHRYIELVKLLISNSPDVVNNTTIISNNYVECRLTGDIYGELLIIRDDLILFNGGLHVGELIYGCDWSYDNQEYNIICECQDDVLFELSRSSAGDIHELEYLSDNDEEDE